jgi:uncharacterized protein involved in exopolysaccharide biosynthesis
MAEDTYLKQLREQLFQDIDTKNNEVKLLQNRITTLEKEIKFRQKQYHNEISDHRKLKSEQKDSRDISATSQ